MSGVERTLPSLLVYAYCYFEFHQPGMSLPVIVATTKDQFVRFGILNFLRIRFLTWLVLFSTPSVSQVVDRLSPNADILF